MKTIKVFLASSEELEDDRNAFGNLVRKLNKTYEKRGIHLELFEWEDYDAAFNDRRKQDEYNDEVRASDMFLAVFHTKAGKFTIEEFDVATEEFREKGSPKSYVYCKDLRDGEIESEELKEFKRRLFDEMGHYWSRYANRDTMQLHFVMQLQMVENSRGEELKVEDGNVVLNGQTVARMENLPFAGQNEAYQKMSARLAELPGKIENLRMLNEQMSGQEFLQNELQNHLNEYNKLKEEFADYQNNLFATAQRMAKLQGERISERMRRAMDAFNNGKVHEANIILDEAERDADKILEGVKELKAVGRQSVDELKIKASCMIADTAYPIDERVEKTESIYEKAISLAKECNYDEKQYIDLLFEYGEFLRTYAKYDKALGICLECKDLCEKVFGVEHSSTAASYNEIGVVYYNLGNYNKALEYYFKTLEIYEKVLGAEHPNTATSYNNIGLVYENLGDYNKALEYYFKSLEISEKVLGAEHPNTATSYNNIGLVYGNIDDYDKALEYCFKALQIREKVLGAEHPDTAASYNNIGMAYRDLGDYDKALEYCFKSLEISEKVLGAEHPDTATSYNNIGGVYDFLGDYNKALEFHFKALEIYEKVLGVEHPNTAASYGNIGLVYDNIGNYDKALEYYFKDLEIQEKTLGVEHPYTATSYGNIGVVYVNLGNYDKALEYHFKALEIRKKVLGAEHPNTAASYNVIGVVYYNLGNYDKALEYYFKSLKILEKVLGAEHPYTITLYSNIAYLYEQLGESDKATEYRAKAQA